MSIKSKSKKILITAGPVWVPIDDVRVISNIFSGRLGFEIAKESLKRGCNVTLLYGPGRVDLSLLKGNISIIRFHYYNELKEILFNQLSRKKFDIIFQSAAISDYQPIIPKKGKIKSGKSRLIIKLKPTIKLVDQIKNRAPNAILVKFKLEVNKSKAALIHIAKKSLAVSDADYIVANDFNTVAKSHEAYIISKFGELNKVVGKRNIARKLFDLLLENKQ